MTTQDKIKKVKELAEEMLGNLDVGKENKEITLELHEAEAYLKDIIKQLANILKAYERQ
jgi:hypothetical protein